MLIRTKHFACYAGRDWMRCDPLSFDVGVAIGERVPPEPSEICGNYIRLWRLTFRLLPIFIWEQVWLGYEHGRAVTQDRIIGIRNWPFWFCYHNSKKANKMKATNSETLKRWDRHEIAEVKRMVKRGEPTRAIAKTLKRTEGAVRQRASAEGISLRV